MITVCHIITGLGTGGAETTLVKLVSAMDRNRFRNRVISLGDIGALGPTLKALDIPVDAAGMRDPMGCVTGFKRLLTLVRRESPQIVQTWMYHANLLGAIAASTLDEAPVVWNLRRGRLDKRIDKRTTLWTSRACALLSNRLPARIVCCSEAARAYHAANGYATDKMLVIPNGFDVEAFRPDREAREQVRRQLGIGADTILIGLVARFDPPKDHLNFVRAAAIVGARQPQAQFVLCGRDVDWDNAELTRWIDEKGLRSRVHLLGNRKDVAKIMASLDVAVSSSRIEGFPNAVGEAMAAGVPVVVTDVGDSRHLVGVAGELAPASDAETLAGGIDRLCGAGPKARSEVGAACRKRVAEYFSLSAVTRQYEQLYESLAETART